MRTILATGASSGIGRAAALALAGPSTRLVLAGRNRAALQESADACRDAGSEAHVALADFSAPKDVDRLAHDCLELADDDPIHLINAAGFARFGPFHEHDLDTDLQQIEVMLAAPLRLCHRLIPAMADRGFGRIVNVLSVAATHVFPGAAAYSAAKAGLLAAGRSLMAEYRDRGVQVCAIVPGATDTPLWDTGSGPDRADMLPPERVGEAIRFVLDAPADMSVDEIVVLPPRGIL